MSIEITKVKLVKDGKKLALGIKESGKVKADDEKTCHNPVHPDLKAAIQALAPHMAYLTHSEFKQKEDPKFIERFTISGYSIGGKEDNEGVVITGHKSVDHGTVVLNSPFVLFGAEPGARYINMDTLLGQIKVIEEEVKLYLNENKHGEENSEDEEDNQLGMFDDDGKPITHAQIAKPVKKVFGKEIPLADGDAMERVANDGEQPSKKTRKRKVVQSAETPSGTIEEPLGPGLDQPN